MQKRPPTRQLVLPIMPRSARPQTRRQMPKLSLVVPAVQVKPSEATPRLDGPQTLRPPPREPLRAITSVPPFPGTVQPLNVRRPLVKRGLGPMAARAVGMGAGAVSVTPIPEGQRRKRDHPSVTSPLKPPAPVEGMVPSLPPVRAADDSQSGSVGPWDRQPAIRNHHLTNGSVVTSRPCLRK